MAPTTARRKKKTPILHTIPTLERLIRNPVLLRNRFRQKLEVKTQALRKTLSLWKAFKRKNNAIKKTNGKIKMRLETAYEAFFLAKKYKNSCKEVIDQFSLWNVESPDPALKKLDPKLRPFLALRLDRWRKRVADTEWFKAYKESGSTEKERREIGEKERKICEMQVNIEAFRKVDDLLPSLDTLPIRGVKAAVIELLCPELAVTSQSIPKPYDTLSSDEDIESENEWSDYDPFAGIFD